MDTSELYARGLRRRKKLFGEADVAGRMAAAGEFGAPLQNIINAYVYGDVWERPGLTDAMRSLVMLGMMAASNKPAEFRVHARVRWRTAARPRRFRMSCCWWRCIAACRPRSSRRVSPLKSSAKLPTLRRSRKRTLNEIHSNR